jgi:uncharacterized protein (TIGR02466 family)
LFVELSCWFDVSRPEIRRTINDRRAALEGPSCRFYGGSMTRNLFVTKIYEAEIGGEADLIGLAHSVRSLAGDDRAGRRWSSEHNYPGYTSYASLNDLPRRDPVIGDLAKILTKHASVLAKACAFDLARKPRLDSLWVNLLRGSGHHSAHIHPHSFISGTLYVEVPKGSGAIRFEDPRLPMMMAAPTRRADAAEELLPFVTVEPRPGLLLLWESWLRHEVLSGSGRGERLSISFNFS